MTKTDCKSIKNVSSAVEDSSQQEEALNAALDKQPTESKEQDENPGLGTAAAVAGSNQLHPHCALEK